MVVNTDGELELPDYFRTSRDGGSRTGLSVTADASAAYVADARGHRLREAAGALPAGCRCCAHRDGCGGGALSGRLDAAGEVTAAPSVLCHDHLRLFDAIAERVDAALQRGRQAVGAAGGA